MAKHDEQYLRMVQYVLQHGVNKSDRTGTGTRSIFGYQMRFDLRDGSIPLLTTKKVHTKSIVNELLWFLEGSTSNARLNQAGVTIWDEWAREDGDLGPIYGYQWRKWNKFTPSTVDADGTQRYAIKEIDQIASLVNKLKNNPDDRRLLVSAWNVSDIDEMALPPCHYCFQCYSRPIEHADRVSYAMKHNLVKIDAHTEFGSHPADYSNLLLNTLDVPTRELSLMINQRSCDVALGVPFNIAQYAILMRMIAEITNHAPGELIWNGGDVHIYSNHHNGLETQVLRDPKESPRFNFARPVADIDDFGYNDFVISNYTPDAAIKFDVAV